VYILLTTVTVNYEKLTMRTAYQSYLMMQ